MVLESPFYGLRRPSYQSGSKLQRVSDLLTLGRTTIEESLCLLHWLTKQGSEQLGGGQPHVDRKEGVFASCFRRQSDSLTAVPRRFQGFRGFQWEGSMLAW
jgi:Alpha/beta hydrolase domain containing 18